MDWTDFVPYALVLVFLAGLIFRPYWTFKLNRLIPASPEGVWRLLVDISNAAYFNADTEKIELVPDADEPNLIWCTVRKKGRPIGRKYAVRVLESTL